MTSALCNALAREGARFNRDKFERASGITEWLAGHATTGTDPRQPRGAVSLPATGSLAQRREAARLRRVGYP